MKPGASGALTPDGIPGRGSITTVRPPRVVRLKVINAAPVRRKRSLENLIARPSVARKGRAGPRTRSLGSTPITRAEREELVEIEAALAADGVTLGPPRTFGLCPPGPCARASCRHNLRLDVVPNRLGHPGDRRRTPLLVKLAHPDRDVDQMIATCSLRVATLAAIRRDPPPATHGKRRGEPGTQPVMSLDEIGEILGVSIELVRQIEDSALAKLRAAGAPALGAG